MSDDSADAVVDRLLALLPAVDEALAALGAALLDGAHDGDVGELAADLWDLLDEVEDVLATIDLEEVPDAIDVDQLPEAVDVEDVPEGLFDADENAIELTSVRQAVDLRELWEALDLTALYEETQELDAAVDEIRAHLGDADADDEGLAALLTGGDDADGVDDELFENVVGTEGADLSFDAEARQAVIEEQIRDAVVAFRKMLLATHEELRTLYEANQEKLGQPGRQPDSRNPTARSTMPSGPVPKTASLRTSTVPSQVRYSRVENPRRIFAHRFESASADEPDPDSADDTEGEQAEAEAADGEGEPAADADEEITLEVHDE